MLYKVAGLLMFEVAINSVTLKLMSLGFLKEKHPPIWWVLGIQIDSTL